MQEFRDRFEYGKPEDYTGHNKELFSVKDEEAYIEECLRRWEWAPTKAAFAHQGSELIADMESAPNQASRKKLNGDIKLLKAQRRIGIKQIKTMFRASKKTWPRGLKYVPEKKIYQAVVHFTTKSQKVEVREVVEVPPHWLKETYGPFILCLLYTSPSPRDLSTSRMPSSA